MNQIKAIIQAKTKAKDYLSKETFIAKLCCEWGISRRTALEYIENIVQADYAHEHLEEGEKFILWGGAK